MRLSKEIQFYTGPSVGERPASSQITSSEQTTQACRCLNNAAIHLHREITPVNERLLHRLLTLCRSTTRDTLLIPTSDCHQLKPSPSTTFSGEWSSPGTPATQSIDWPHATRSPMTELTFSKGQYRVASRPHVDDARTGRRKVTGKGGDIQRRPLREGTTSSRRASNGQCISEELAAQQQHPYPRVSALVNGMLHKHTERKWHPHTVALPQSA